MEESRKTWVTMETINPKGARTRILFGSVSQAMQIRKELSEVGWRVNPIMRATRDRPQRPRWEQIRAVEILDQLKKGKLKPKSEIQT